MVALLQATLGSAPNTAEDGFGIATVELLLLLLLLLLLASALGAATNQLDGFGI
jgi:predicted small secreted protein